MRENEEPCFDFEAIIEWHCPTLVGGVDQYRYMQEVSEALRRVDQSSENAERYFLFTRDAFEVETFKILSKEDVPETGETLIVFSIIGAIATDYDEWVDFLNWAAEGHNWTEPEFAQECVKDELDRYFKGTELRLIQVPAAQTRPHYMRIVYNCLIEYIANDYGDEMMLGIPALYYDPYDDEDPRCQDQDEYLGGFLAGFPPNVSVFSQDPDDYVPFAKWHHN